jgi:hypothetical protein
MKHIHAIDDGGDGGAGRGGSNITGFLNITVVLGIVLISP